MEFHNPGYFLKPGMFATVQVTSELEPSALLIPDMAILRSGEKTTVFVALDGGKFDPRTVTLGPQAENDTYQVLSGLQRRRADCHVGPVHARFGKPASRGDPEDDGAREIGAGRASRPRGQPASQELAHEGAGGGAAPEDAQAVKYICPMPEHISIDYDHPGNCPICGMTLVPVSAATLLKLQPGGKILYYTCPMPEHSDVHSDKPGKCPKCGMTLIPVMEAPPRRGRTKPTSLRLSTHH